MICSFFFFHSLATFVFFLEDFWSKSSFYLFLVALGVHSSAPGVSNGANGRGTTSYKCNKRVIVHCTKYKGAGNHRRVNQLDNGLLNFSDGMNEEENATGRRERSKKLVTVIHICLPLSRLKFFSQCLLT